MLHIHRMDNLYTQPLRACPDLRALGCTKYNMCDNIVYWIYDRNITLLLPSRPQKAPPVSVSCSIELEHSHLISS
jgi:hypothetical protein